MLIYYTLPFKALNTHAFAKKPTPTAPKPQPAVSSYLNAPNAIKSMPIRIMIKVAQPSTVFLFIPIVCGIYFEEQISEKIVSKI